jgi:hypothetical protein
MADHKHIQELTERWPGARRDLAAVILRGGSNLPDWRHKDGFLSAQRTLYSRPRDAFGGAICGVD